MHSCDICWEFDCKHCAFGNPCLGCEDYDVDNDECTSDGGCGEEQLKEQSND